VAAKKKAATLEAGSVDELTHVLAMSLKYQGVPQVVLVHDMTKAGMAPKRIADLLGTTNNSVSQAKRQKRPKWPPK
jgi:hypothetical protein